MRYAIGLLVLVGCGGAVEPGASQQGPPADDGCTRYEQVVWQGPEYQAALSCPDDRPELVSAGCWASGGPGDAGAQVTQSAPAGERGWACAYASGEFHVTLGVEVCCR